MIIWETSTLSEIGRHRLHHASVAAVAVSPSDALVVSAGGMDADYVVWDLADTKSPLCGKHFARLIRRSFSRNDLIAVLFSFTLTLILL